MNMVVIADKFSIIGKVSLGSGAFFIICFTEVTLYRSDMW